MKITNYRPIVFVTISLLLGVMVGGLVYENNLFVMLVPIALIALGTFLLLVFKKKQLFCIILFFAIGISIFKIDNLCTFSGEITQDNVLCQARVMDNTGSYILVENLTIDGKKHKGKMLLRNKFGDVDTGTLVEFLADITTNDVNIFDSYQMSKYYDNIFYEADNIKIVKVGAGEKKVLEKITDKINNIILDNMPREEGGIAVSLVFGDMNYITDSDNEIMRNTGLSHIFSVSGLHVGFLVAIFLFIGKKLRLKAWVRFVMIFAILILYGILTGFPSGVKRAGIMSLIYLFGVMIGRKNDPLTTLSLAVFIIVITNCKELFDISFLMSAAAIFGMVCFYTPVKRFLQGRSYKKSRKYFASSIAATVSANVFLIPISFNIFNSFATYQLVANMLLLPLVTFIYTALMPVIVLSYVFPILGKFYMVLSYPISILRLITSLIDKVPMATLDVVSMGFMTAVYILVALVLSPFINKTIPMRKLGKIEV
jgi:ComEC/Rec2-related protein